MCQNDFKKIKSKSIGLFKSKNLPVVNRNIVCLKVILLVKYSAMKKNDIH